MKNIHIVFLFILAALIGFQMCKRENFDSVEGLEGFASIDDARQAVREVYNADIDAIRNLSTVATKLQAGGLAVPGVLKTNKINLTTDRWENQHEGNGKSYVVNDDGIYKKLMLVGNDSGGGGVRRVGMWDDVEISRNLQVNGSINTSGNITAGGDMNVGSGRTIASQGRLHITGAELLYILNKNGVIIGKEWGGNGNLAVQGDMTVQGRNILAELNSLRADLNDIRANAIRYNDTINITNRGTGNHEGYGTYIGFCGSGGGGCNMVNVMLSGEKGRGALKIERN